MVTKGKKSIEPNKEDNKKELVGHKFALGIIIFGIIAIIGVIILFFSNNILTGKVISNIDGNYPNAQKICKDVQIPYEDQEQYIKTEYYTESVPYTDKECETKNLAYSVTEFVFNSEVCNKQGDVCNDRTIFDICTKREYYCMDKTITCSLNINNLDNEQGGNFAVSFNFFPTGTNDIEMKQSSTYLYPSTSQIFLQSANIISEGIAGKANKKFSCSYMVSSIPTKQVCRDVTKYQDVQRERQVTAYRPVIKYKTENQCN